MNFQIVSLTAPHVTLLLASMLWHPNIRTKVGSVVDASELAKLTPPLGSLRKFGLGVPFTACCSALHVESRALAFKRSIGLSGPVPLLVQRAHPPQAPSGYGCSFGQFREITVEADTGSTGAPTSSSGRREIWITKKTDGV